MVEIKVKKLVGVMEKMRGLIGAKTPYPVYFRTRWGIHTFGVTRPIDVVILDARCKISVMKEKLQPNRLFFWPLKYNQVVELPEGEIKKLKIKIGETVKFLPREGEENW